MSNALRPRFDAELIAKYGGAGPRYTSYPTAVQFHENFGPKDWLAALHESNQMPIPADLSLYVHVPFCASPCFYCGCNRVITRSVTAGQEFLVDLERELDLTASQIDSDRRVRQVHLGGGTPTFLSSDQIDQLMRLLRTRFQFADNPEIGLEVDPRSVEPSDIRRLKEIGFNRISIGIQDLDPNVQQAVNRIHDETQVAAIVGAARAVGFESISVDLIYGLPRQTTEGFARTVEHVIDMRPSRLSLFNYAHLPHLFKAQQRINSEELPSPSVKLAIFRNTLTRLLDAGYEFIGMDHFALPGDDLAVARRENTMVRNFQGYSTCGGLDLLAFGPSAISQVGDTFSQNQRKIMDWQIVARDSQLPIARGLVRNTDDHLRAEIISKVMCSGALDYREFEREFEVSFKTYFATELQRLASLVEDGLIQWREHGFEATAEGLLFLRAVAMAFDTYLKHDESESKRFSRIV
ncbi:MAG: oxygen-independent coproporphyrinogen III oxidase [Gammaproteobacteria bacterium HGW-Gammaproteobacteria-8]|nr:MAG: oxygen-independent coproporphyrinogen III oxidase [Gammaproteobacteria bacterium HGW-Gammaproteobacteria-8]